MLVVLSAFNGLEALVMDTYASVHPDITVTSSEGSRFHLSDKTASALPDLLPNGFYRVQEQKALLRSETREVLVNIVGIPIEQWRQTPWMDSLTSAADLPFSHLNEAALGYGVGIQVGLLELSGREGFELLWPNGQPDLGLDVASHFARQRISPTRIFRVHPQVDQNTVVVDLESLQAWTGDTRISALHAWKVSDVEAVQTALAKLDPTLIVQRPEDREAALFRVMKSEGLITTAILAFIVFLASLGLYSATVLLGMEKSRQRAILRAMGMSQQQVRLRFWWSGMWVSGLGGLMGLLLGGLLLAGQSYFGWVSLGSGYVVAAYPVDFSWAQALWIFAFVLLVGGLLSAWATQGLKTQLEELRS
jgi:lipoprotein-releasing system permease protein